jgi:hypothetical protein
MENAMIYRSYDLEQKQLMVGWQVITTKDGAFVRNGSISKSLESALIEARAHVDTLHPLPPVDDIVV